MCVRCVWILFCAATFFGQSTGERGCLLDTATNGDLVKMRGAVFPTGHDVFIRPTGCEASPGNRVILVWGDDPILGANKIGIRKDAAFEEFNRLLRTTIPLPTGGVGAGQSKYRIVADFEGRLEISASAGIKRDPKNKKVVGIEGFGHPMPYTRFRLVATSVSSIDAKERQPVDVHAVDGR